MNNLSLRLIYLCCGFFLSACSTTSNVASFTPRVAETGQATVYIYRPTQMANSLYSPALLVNDSFKLYAKNAVNSRLSLHPGEYVFAFQNEKKYSELTPLSLILKADSVYFVRINTSLKISDSAQYQRYARSFTMSQIDASQAIREIAECCTNTAIKLNHKQTENANNNAASDGFSVDKTQNPFSH